MTVSLFDALRHGDPNLDRVLDGLIEAELRVAMQTCRMFYRAITWKRPRLYRYFDGQWQVVRVDLRRLAVAGREACTASVYPLAPRQRLQHVSSRVCTLLADAESASSTLLVKTTEPDPLNGILVRRGAASWQHFLRGEFVLAHGDSFALDVQKIAISAFSFASYEPRLKLAPRLALDVRAPSLEGGGGARGGEASGGGEAGPAASESGVADALDEQQLDAEDLSAAVETVDRDDTCPAERAPGAPTPRHACYAHFA